MSFISTLRVLESSIIYLDITLDLVIPTYFAVAIGESNIGQLFCVGSASHLDGTKAILKALVETAQERPYLRYEFFREPDWSCRDDFQDVIDFDDHARVYTRRPDLINRLEFCTSNDFATKKRVLNKSALNPEEDLRNVLSILKAKDLDVLVIDLTTPDVKEIGLKVVRVLMPGLQPLHGDHRYPFLGGKRLYDVPCKVGLRDSPIGESDIFSLPHPFP